MTHPISNDGYCVINQDRTFKRLLSNEDGLEIVEWILLLGGLIIPMAAAMMKVAYSIAGYYAFVSWVISLPFT